MARTKETDSPPIIVRRVRKSGHGHHGGAWKVAFADFVTAMMAFFLLLWLLGSTTKEQQRGISEYFLDPAGVADAAGTSRQPIDFGGGFPAPTGGGDTPNVSTHPAAGEAPTAFEATPDDAALERLATEREREHMEDLRSRVEKMIQTLPELAQFREHILVDVTDEGLRVQITDRENRPMFDTGSSTLQDYARAILASIVDVIGPVPNRISIAGHTDHTPYLSSDGYSNWELSADRANAARRELLRAGLAESKIGRVVGFGSSVPFDAANPLDPINRRISLVVLNRGAEAALSSAAGQSSAAKPVGETGAGIQAPPVPGPRPSGRG